MIQVNEKIKAVYARYERWSSIWEKNAAENILKNIAKKLWLEFEELIKICEEKEVVCIKIIFPKIFVVYMNNLHGFLLKKLYWIRRTEYPYSRYTISYENNKNYTYEFYVNKDDEKVAREMINFYTNKCKEDYKTFMRKKPTIDDFLDAIIQKNNLYWIPKEKTEEDEKEISRKDIEDELNKYRRAAAIMQDLDDSDFIPSNRMIWI